MNRNPFASRSLAMYAALQSGALVCCWTWFLVLVLIASLNFDIEQLEWWFLTAAALAGLYGLRPNLEKAIDRTWLGDVKNPNMLTERAAKLRPIKRRIDLVFSAVVTLLLVGTMVLWVSGYINLAGKGHS